MSNGECTVGARNTTKIEDLGTRMDKIDIILEKVRNRPTWIVTVIITILSSISTGLTIAAIVAK